MPTIELDPDQRAAVDHRDGACLVLAGPGSGKTRVIVERFLALCGGGLPAERQLVLTYTVKAAAEMRQRAEAAHGPFLGEVPLTNFHSFSRRVLREWGWLVGVPPAFHIADVAERWLHLDAVLAELRPRTLWNPLRPHDLIDSLLSLIENAKQELITPEEYAAWATQRLQACGADPVERALLERHAECAAVYAGLVARYRRHAVLDHDDCILLAEQLLREQPAVRRAICDVVGQVMVDEYQDTNFAQARLVETLVADHGNIMVVADDDQAIYKFRGASLANLDRFKREFPGHRTVVLRRNYRSTRQIVGVCRALIGTAAPVSRIPKHLDANRGDGDRVELWAAPDERTEVVAVARQCRRLVDEGMTGSSIAWLFRRHDHMRAAMAALQEERVAYQVSGGRGYFRQPEVKDLLALLSAIADPSDSQSLIRCLHLPAWNVTNKGRLAVVAACRAEETPLHRLLAEELVPGLDDADREAARGCAETIVDLHGESLVADVRELVFEAMERSGFLGVARLERDLERIQAGANLSKFSDLLEAFADWGSDLRLGAALRYLDILRDSGAADEVAPIDPVEDGVLLLTAHSAKGLEWPVVVVAGCADSRWPGRGGFPSRLSLPDELIPEKAPPGDAVVDEERRLFYVATTRARDRLILTRAQRYPRSFEDERTTRFLQAIAEDAAAPVPIALACVPGAPGRRMRAEAPALPSRLEVGVRDLRDFRECPRRYAYRRRFRMPARPSVHAWYGTLMHAVVERAGRMRLSGDDVGPDQAAELWNAAWEAQPGPKGAHPELRGHGVETLRRYIASPAWTDAPLSAVEAPFALPVDAGQVAGRFDRIDLPGDGMPTVVDYKTGPPMGAESAERDLQVRAYAVALAQRERADAVAVELHNLQAAEVTRVELDEKRLRRAFGHVSATAADLVRAWDDGHFPPHPAPWRCRRCDYRTVCDERVDE